ncbi:hypothetical protein AAHE18_13G136100 [Arachis hypogaea]
MELRNYKVQCLKPKCLNRKQLNVHFFDFLGGLNPGVGTKRRTLCNLEAVAANVPTIGSIQAVVASGVFEIGTVGGGGAFETFGGAALVVGGGIEASAAGGGCLFFCGSFGGLA